MFAETLGLAKKQRSRKRSFMPEPGFIVWRFRWHWGESYGTTAGD